MCKADGFPMPKIIWRREDGQAINIERQKKGTYNKSIDSYTYIYRVFHKLGLFFSGATAISSKSNFFF
nr:unnamed protein product [Callosobruchus chinensis]